MVQKEKNGSLNIKKTPKNASKLGDQKDKQQT